MTAAMTWSRGQPVNHLIQITARFAQGDWRARVNLTGNDEFATIGAAFNQMAEQLTANHQRNQHFY